MHPVGRLDCDTSGLLLFSNNGELLTVSHLCSVFINLCFVMHTGDLTSHLLNPSNRIEREYSAVVLDAVDVATLSGKLRTGVTTSDGVVKARLSGSRIISDNDKVNLN